MIRKVYTAANEEHPSPAPLLWFLRHAAALDLVRKIRGARPEYIQLTQRSLSSEDLERSRP